MGTKVEDIHLKMEKMSEWVQKIMKKVDKQVPDEPEQEQ